MTYCLGVKTPRALFQLRGIDRRYSILPAVIALHIKARGTLVPGFGFTNHP